MIADRQDLVAHHPRKFAVSGFFFTILPSMTQQVFQLQGKQTTFSYWMTDL